MGHFLDDQTRPLGDPPIDVAGSQPVAGPTTEGRGAAATATARTAWADERRRQAGMGAVAAGLALVMWPASPLWVLLAGITLVTAVGVPLILSAAPRAARIVVGLAVVLVAVLGAWAPYARVTGSGSARDRTHDGGVTVTREAARLAARGENPYTARYDEVLPASWAEVEGIDGDLVANPVIDHEPYLPASFLIQVPFAEVASAFGAGWDPRILGWIALTATVVALARRPGPAWTRVSAVATMANAYVFTYLAWGTNDGFAVCCFVLALVLADGGFRRVEGEPGSRAAAPDLAASPGRIAGAGVLLAVAISCKFLFLVAVPPLAVVVLARGGWAAARRWWSLPAVLAVTCLPYLAWSPSAFLDDVLWFNLGRTEPKMPTSGLGLPAISPTLFQGAVLAVVTLAGLVVAFGLVPWLANRLRSIAWVGPLTALGLLGLLVPARTFQINYLVLVVAAAATGWWTVGASPRTGIDDAEAPAGARVISR